MLLHLGRVLGAVGEAQSAGNAYAVGVRHHYAGGVVHVAQNQVGGLAAHTGQLEQLLHGVGHPAAVLLHQHAGGGYNVPGLGPEEAGGMDIGFHLGGVGLGQRLQGGKAGKEGGSDHVDPLIGTLGGQTHGKEQLVGLGVLERTEPFGV